MKIKRFGFLLLFFNLILICFNSTALAKGQNIKEHTITVKPSQEAQEFLDILSPEYGTLCYDLYEVDEDKYRNSVTKENLDSEYFEYVMQEFKLRVGDEGTMVNEPANATYTGLSLNEPHVIKDGLYLLVVRGTLNNKTVVKTNNIAVSGIDNETQYKTGLVTYSLLDYHIYTVTPQLILNDENINLKMEVDPATGSIKINKSIFYKYYKDVENTVFVFRVDVLYPTENDLYSSEVYSLNFEASDFDNNKIEDVEKTIYIEGLPINSIVRITEIYKGLSYETTIDQEKTDVTEVKVRGDEVVNVDIVNVYKKDKPNQGGGGITNRFEFKLVTSSWEWTQEKGNAATINGASDKFLKKILDLNK